MLLRRLLGYPISFLVMPAQMLHGPYHPHLRFQTTDKNLSLSRHTIPSSNQACVEFTEISHRRARALPRKNQKVIIHAVGNSDCYENHMKEYEQLAKKCPNYRIVGFDFRGVGLSMGHAWSEDDWINDALAMIKHFEAQGIQPKNILLNGHSLGGALVTLAANKHYQQAKAQAMQAGQNLSLVQSVNVINNRSFANLTDELVVSFAPNSLLTGVFYGGLIATLLSLPLLSTIVFTSLFAFATRYVSENITRSLVKPFVKALLWLSFGTLNAAAAYQMLPLQAVDHIVARNDSVIKDKGSMHHALRPFNKEIKVRLRKIIDENPPGDNKKKTTAVLMNMKDSKVMYHNNPHNGMSAHNYRLGVMHTYHKLRRHQNARHLPAQITGDIVMANKIKRLLSR